MLSTCRPHGGTTEHEFIKRFILPHGAEADDFGNLWIRVGDAPILWSSHVDTCHRRDGTQQYVIDSTSIVRLANGSPANCLGADCTAGVWLMTEMIEAEVPGLYVFHRGEERGGLGSRYAAQMTPEYFTGIKSAIAFDRRGTHSIITHQRSERCCSDAFAASLANAIGLGHTADPTGLFTDTANYTDLVGECTNISIGYMDEHSPSETLNLGYLLKLRDAVLSADFTGLVYSRQPGEFDPDLFGDSASYDAQAWSPSRRSVYDLVRDHPAAIADFLEMNGISADELENYLACDVPF